MPVSVRNCSRLKLEMIEEGNGIVNAYEIKWKEGKMKVPKAWAVSYPDSPVKLINTDNYLEFIT